MRTASWILTVIFGLLFLVGWINALSIHTSYGSPGTSFPYIFGLLIANGIIPSILWTITLYKERKKGKNAYNR
jgi:hypothetical protein